MGKKVLERGHSQLQQAPHPQSIYCTLYGIEKLINIEQYISK
jgi:hypothetical protein